MNTRICFSAAFEIKCKEIFKIQSETHIKFVYKICIFCFAFFLLSLCQPQYCVARFSLLWKLNVDLFSSFFTFRQPNCNQLLADRQNSCCNFITLFKTLFFNVVTALATHCFLPGVISMHWNCPRGENKKFCKFFLYFNALTEGLIVVEKLLTSFLASELVLHFTKMEFSLEI